MIRRLADQSGFSLLEMLVAMVLVLASLLLAADLLQEAGQILRAAEGELTNPLTGITTDRLRQDVQASSALFSSGLGWTPGALTLRREGDTVVYAQEDEQLVRTVTDEAGEVTSREAWIRSLLLWRWQPTGSNLVEVEIVYGTAADFSRWRLDGAPSRPRPGVARENLLLALRGRGRAGGW